MKVLDPGHLYELQSLDGGPSGAPSIRQARPKFPRNVGHYPGTNMQEVLRAVLNRLGYVNLQEHDDRNVAAGRHLMEAIYLLEERAAERHERKPPTLFEACHGSTCGKCGHVGCQGTCHS